MSGEEAAEVFGLRCLDIIVLCLCVCGRKGEDPWQHYYAIIARVMGNRSVKGMMSAEDYRLLFDAVIRWCAEQRGLEVVRDPRTDGEG